MHFALASCILCNRSGLLTETLGEYKIRPDPLSSPPAQWKPSKWKLKHPLLGLTESLRPYLTPFKVPFIYVEFLSVLWYTVKLFYHIG